MLQRVFDNDYMPKIVEFGWPERWTADPDAANWQNGHDGGFVNDGRGTGEQWLRYRHFTPTPFDWARLERTPEWQRCHGRDAQPSSEDWKALREAGHAIGADVRPRLITDFTAFDTSWSRASRWPKASPPTGDHWVGDLAVACTAEVENDTGVLGFELRKGGRRFDCRIDAATGRATLSIGGADMRNWRPTAATRLRGRGSHDILFSNCDNELRLWIDGQVVAFDPVQGNSREHPTAYADLGNHQPREDDEHDLAPVGVGSAGAQVRISHLRIQRNIYYIADQWPALNRLIEDSPAGVTFQLERDQFFMMGDNSSNSSDARLWGPNHYVNRDLLIGKAFFLYWPHSWNEIPTPWGNIPCPFFPNFRRMGFVR